MAAAPEHDLVINLGDLVGYGASPNQVIAKSRGLGKTFVRGNHDKAVCGTMDMIDFNPIAAAAALWTRDELTPESMEWLRALPQGPVQMEEFPDVQFVHGSPLDEDEYVVSLKDAVEPLLTSSSSVTFFGHTHLQGIFSATNDHGDTFRPTYKTVGSGESCEYPLRPGVRYMVNPGSVGQPRDGDWRAAFALFDADAGVITFCRVPYNLRGAQERILAAELPPRLAARLAVGR